jgi:hypothetical protein
VIVMVMMMMVMVMVMVMVGIMLQLACHTEESMLPMVVWVNRNWRYTRQT